MLFDGTKTLYHELFYSPSCCTVTEINNKKYIAVAADDDNECSIQCIYIFVVQKNINNTIELKQLHQLSV